MAAHARVEPSYVPASELNRLLQLGVARADALEPKLVALLEPILRAAGDEAARRFEEMATDHLAAAAVITEADLYPAGMLCGDCERPFEIGDLYDTRPFDPAVPDVVMPVCAACLSLTAAAPAGWSPPAGDEIVDVDSIVSKLRTKTDPVRMKVVETMMTPILGGAGIAFDATNPLAAKVLSQAGSQVVGIADTTRLNVMRIVKASHEQGLTIPDTAKAIRAGMKSSSVARATLIARTEIVGAVNGGSLAATQIVSDATGVEYLKEWLTSPGAVYPRHEEYEGLDGQQVALDEYFDVGGDELQFPGDPDGSPEEVCNCRCTMVYTDSAGGDGEPAGDAEEGFAAPSAAAPSAEPMAPDDALEYYHSPKAFELNGALRDGKPLTAEQESVVAGLDAQFTPAAEDMLLWRGVPDQAAVYGDSLTSKDVISTRGYLSASTEKDSALEFASGIAAPGDQPVLEQIFVPKGTPILRVPAGDFGDQNEILLPRGLDRTVNGFQKTQDPYNHFDSGTLRVIRTDASGGDVGGIKTGPPQEAFDRVPADQRALWNEKGMTYFHNGPWSARNSIEKHGLLPGGGDIGEPHPGQDFEVEVKGVYGHEDPVWASEELEQINEYAEEKAHMFTTYRIEVPPGQAAAFARDSEDALVFTQTVPPEWITVQDPVTKQWKPLVAPKETIVEKVEERVGSGPLSTDSYVAGLQQELSSLGNKLGNIRSYLKRDLDPERRAAYNTRLKALERRRKDVRELIATPDPKAELTRISNQLGNIYSRQKRGAGTLEHSIRQEILEARQKELKALINGEAKAEIERQAAKVEQVAAVTKQEPKVQAEVAREPGYLVSADPGGMFRPDSVSWLSEQAPGTGAANYFRIPPTEINAGGGSYQAREQVAVLHPSGVLLRAELGHGMDAAETAKNLERSYTMYDRSVPPWMEGRLQSVQSLLGSNPQDEYWAKQYNMPGFQSAATGGRGGMQFYGGRFLRGGQQSTFDHELGHVIGTWGGPLDTGEWQRAQLADQTSSRARYGFTTKARVYNVHHDVYVGGPAVSTYGEVAINEDWAESIRLYLEDKRNGNLGVISDASGRRTELGFRAAFPERARLIEKWLKPS